MADIARDHRTGCIVDDQLVVLDRSVSRYMLAPQASQPPCAPFVPDGRTTLLSWADDVALRRDTARERWLTQARAVQAQVPRAGIATLARLRFLEWRCATTLRRGLDRGLRMLETCEAGDDRPQTRAALLSAAHLGRRLWSSQDRCLPRSLALTYALRKAGSNADLVLGVSLNPFAAHAWVQEGDVVLNDALDHVLLFTPILVA